MEIIEPQVPTSEYGWVDAGGAHPATREELLHACRDGAIPRLVWTPEAPAGAPPEDVPYLLAAIRARLAGGAKTQALIAGGIVAVIALQNRADLHLGSPLVVYLSFGLVWAAFRVYEWRQAERLTPQGFRDLMRGAEEAAAVRRAPVTYLRWMTAMIAAIGVVQLLAGGGDMERASDGGAMIEAAIRQGQWWRLLTSAFLHANLIHIGVNFMALLSLGRDTEVLAHRAFLPLVFLVAALAGALASFLLPPDVPSVGSSGGLLGLVGFLAVLGYRRQDRLPAGFLRMMLLNLAVIAGIGLLGMGMVDNAAHGGGLVAGLLLGFLFVPSTAARPDWRPGRGVVAAGNAALAILVLGCVWTAVVTVLATRP